MWIQALNEIICNLSNRCEDQTQLDDVYDSFCEKLFAELDKNLRFKYVSKRNRKLIINSKPYWNDELHNLWKEMVKNENKFSKYRGRNRFVKNELYILHKNSQKSLIRH